MGINSILFLVYHFKLQNDFNEVYKFIFGVVWNFTRFADTANPSAILGCSNVTSTLYIHRRYALNRSGNSLVRASTTNMTGPHQYTTTFKTNTCTHSACTQAHTLKLFIEKYIFYSSFLTFLVLTIFNEGELI